MNINCFGTLQECLIHSTTTPTYDRFPERHDEAIYEMVKIQNSDDVIGDAHRKLYIDGLMQDCSIS